MVRCGQWPIFGFALAALFAQGAAAQTFRVPWAGPAAPAKVEASLAGYAGDWQISISYDPGRCELLCEYRKRNALASSFPMPAARILVYSSLVVQPVTIVIQPGGDGLPELQRPSLTASEMFCLPVQDRLPDVPPLDHRGPVTTAFRVRGPDGRRGTTAPRHLEIPLRI